MTQTINGYVELASPQILDDKWRELNFEINSAHNILQDLVVPESGGGYVYKDAKLVNSAVQNRVIYWRTVNDILEFVELSTEVLLDGNQVRIKFTNSPIINNINVIEFSDSIVIMVATLTSVHRLHLPHPKTTNKSVLYELTTDVLYNPANYYILNNHSYSNSNQPICAASWADNSMLKCALSLPNSSILIVQFGIHDHHISINEIKQIGIIGRLWSRMPNLLAKSQNDCDNAIYFCLPYAQPETQDVILFTLCRDWKIRLFSTNTKECICTHSMNQQNSFSQSISHNNATIEQPIMKMLGSQVVIYLTESKPEFVFLNYAYREGAHVLIESSTCQTPNNWEKLLDFVVTEQKIWALAYSGEAQPMLYYLERNIINQTSDNDIEEIEGIWDFVTLVEDIDMPNVKNYVAEIFWRNHFSINTIQKALVGIVGSSVPKKNTFESLEELAFTSIVDDNQDEAWGRFYNYCLQNHQASNKNIGLFVAPDETVIGLVKRSNPSFICPWLTSADMLLQGGPYRGIEFSTNYRAIIESLNYICTYFIDDEHNNLLEQKIFDKPSIVMNSISEVVESQLRTRKVDVTKLNIQKNLTNVVTAAIDSLCDQLDMTKEAEEYGFKILQESSTKFRSGNNPLESNCGITITFELFKRLMRARMNLCRDLLIYMHLVELLNDTDKVSEKPAIDSHNHGNMKCLLDSLRSYALLVWISETSVKTLTTRTDINVINFISKYFKFFKQANNIKENDQDSVLELLLHQNLFMNFLVNGGVNYSTSDNQKTLSNSFYVTDIALNLCKLLWPKTNHLCFAEFLFTNQLDEHLSKYLDLTENWLIIGEYDRHFMKAANCLLQKRASHSVEIFDKLWLNMKCTNLIGRFIELDKDKKTNLDEINPALIHRYYDKLIQLFQIYEDPQSLVVLINHCMSLLDENADKEQQQWLNCFRAKLFQYYLELEEPDEAYHTMVLTTDQSLRTNCLRKFIVHHCEKQQWLNLLSYPYIDIMNDFIEILTQKAESFDLSQINEKDFYMTTFYDLLFASYVSDDEFGRAAEVMYNYAQRLAHEVPGMVSIKKQVDCLLIALNSLKCSNLTEAYIEMGLSNLKEECRTSVLKRSYDCEAKFSTKCTTNEHDEVEPIIQTSNKIYCHDIEIKYELTKARLKLLEKDPTSNAIALSPLKAEETIHQLVKSSMFSAAMDLALLMKAPMEPVLEGLTDKYIFLIGTTINVDIHPEIEQGLTEIFTYSYNNIDTYNYVANSTSSIVDKIWRLIDYYLISYDGIGHRYSNTAFAGTFTSSTVLMKVVAIKILAAGYNIPASLKRMYMARNVSELLRLLMKYDKLIEASELVVEMINRVLEPSNAIAFTSPININEPPPIYLPSHLILLLISFLEEDATNTDHLKIASGLVEKLNKFRRFVKSTQ